MTTLYFQGKYALSYKGSFLEQMYDPPILTPNSTSPTPMGTFILYATTLNPGVAFGTAYFIGAFAQLEGNMQFLVNSPEINGGGIKVTATAPDIGSAMALNWQVPIYPPPSTPPIGVLQVLTNFEGRPYTLGMDNDLGFYFGYQDSTDPDDVGQTILTVITLGLYALTQSQLWPKIDLSFVDLTGQDFSNAYVFTNCNFQQAVLDLANFSGANLSSSNLSSASLASTNFSGKTNLSGANLSGASLTSTIFTGGANLSGAIFAAALLIATDFTGANLSSANFAGASLVETNFTGATLSAANFTGCDLTNVICSGTFGAPTQASEIVILNSATLDFTLINLVWQWLDLRNATVTGIPSPLSTQSNKLQATGAMLSGMNQIFRGMSLEYAVLDNSLLDGLDLSAANLSNASLKNASMHNTKLNDAILTNADLTGAQLGALAQLFPLPLTTQSALNTGDVTTIAPLFKQNGITLSSTATLSTLVANSVWELDDVGNQVVYTIRLESQSGTTTQILNVYEPAEAAGMANAYLPGANLSGANLYGVIANNIQFYGPGALIDEFAILENAQLNGSNLSGLDLSQAQLLGTNLSGSYLIGATFTNANLTESSTNVQANLSDTNLQGADFTDAKLYGANLTNAAVAVSTPTNGGPNTAGVYLFSLPYAGDTHTVQDYESELNAAATHSSLSSSLLSDLDQNDLSTAVKTALLALSPPIILSATATLQPITLNSVWQIIDTPNTYTLWTEPGPNNQTELFVAPSLTITETAFQQNDFPLRWQATATIDTAGQQWLLDNDSENPSNQSTGYITFLLKLNGTVLDVYGTALRILQLGTGNQLQYDTQSFSATVLSASNMTGDTTCPNGATLSVNQQQPGGTWETWMRASAPPKPPACVPTEFTYCPPNSTATETKTAKHEF